jgi:hypothetical protein
MTYAFKAGCSSISDWLIIYWVGAFVHVLVLEGSFLVLWNLPVVIILKQINPVRIFPPCCVTHFNIILPCTPWPPVGFPTKNLYAPICCPVHVTCHTPVIVFAWWSWQYLARSRIMKLLVQFSPVVYRWVLSAHYLCTSLAKYRQSILLYILIFARF